MKDSRIQFVITRSKEGVPAKMTGMEKENYASISIGGIAFMKIKAGRNLFDKRVVVSE